MSLSLQHRRYMMGVVMLLMFMPPGMWVSSLPNMDKRMPDTMRGQAQALFQFLVGSVAGITGAFFCGWLDRVQVTEALDSWVGYWLVLALVALLPLLYFVASVLGSGAARPIPNDPEKMS